MSVEPVFHIGDKVCISYANYKVGQLGYVTCTFSLISSKRSYLDARLFDKIIMEIPFECSFLVARKMTKR